MTGPDQKEFHKPFEVDKVLGPKQLGLYTDILNARRRELLKTGGSRHVIEEERRELAERIKGMSLEEFRQAEEEVARNKPKRTTLAESQFSGLPKPKEPTIDDYKKFNKQRGNFNVDLIAKKND